jgi:hypothetical protein
MNRFPVDMSQTTYSIPEPAPRRGRLRYGGHEGSLPTLGNWQPATPSTRPLCPTYLHCPKAIGTG